MSDVMAKIQDAEKKATEVISAAQEKASALLSDAQGLARKASESIKSAVLSKNASALESLEKDLEKKGADSKAQIEKKVAELKAAAEKKSKKLVEGLVASVTK